MARTTTGCRPAVLRLLLVASLSLLPLMKVLAQPLATEVEVRKPGMIVWLKSYGPKGPYKTPEEAWAERQARLSENPPTPPWKYREWNFRPCEDSGSYEWGVAADWCHNWERYYGEHLEGAGVSSEVKVGSICPDGFSFTHTQPVNGVGNYPEYYERRCERTRTARHPDMCPRVGNPIHPTTGVKRQEEVDYIDPRNLLSFRRTYDSDRGSFVHSFQRDFLPPVAGYVRSGETLYRSIYDYDLSRWLRFPVEAPLLNLTGSFATLFDETGVWYPFNTNGSDSSPQRAFNKDLLGRTSGGGYWVRQNADSKFVVLDPDGNLTAIVYSDGRKADLRYSTQPMLGIAPSAGYLTSVADNFGRAIRFSYENDGRLKTLHLPDDSAVAYVHSIAPELSQWRLGRVRKPLQVTYADGTSKQYLWNEAEYTIAPPETIDMLTGIRDELGIRYATFSYRNGKAVRTEHAGGVDAFEMTDSRSGGSGAVSVVDPLGTTRSLNYAVVDGFSRFTGSSQPAGSGCAASSRAITYDTGGNKASEDDFNGKRACYANDLGRNLEVTSVTGLAAGANCQTYLATGAVLPSGTRRVSTQWHPDWPLRTRTSEPGRMTTDVYNGQPDPFAGGAIASCAPGTAVLPDGKPIAVLCKRVEQATTDANGSQGFSATLQSGVANREQRWTYNQYGQVLTHNGPRTDVNDTTTYAYYTDTSFTGTGSAAIGHTLGDLQSITNAAGQVTRFTKYDKHGQLLESEDPNGVLTVNTYDLRQRLLSTSVGGKTTRYDYDLAGLLRKVTRPDASYIGYEYDAAHRQTAVFDDQGNRIEYELDNAGNRKVEKVKDTGGVLRRQLARSIDALGRVQQTRGRE